MAKTQPTGKQLKDTTIERDDLNVAGAPGTTVIAKIVQGNGIIISSTGTDAGTGDVTINTQIYQGATASVPGVRGDVPAAAAGQQNYFLRGDGTWVVAPGTGTVTSVSVVTANGVSGTVATNTTTPAITIVLGAITPASVAVATSGITGGNIAISSTNDAGSPSLTVANDLNAQCEIGIRGSTRAAYGTLVAGDAYLYSAQPLTIVSDGSVIKFANSGGTERMRVANGVNIGGTSDPGAGCVLVNKHLGGGGTTPTVTAASGAGTSPTITTTGSDTNAKITLLSGSAPPPVSTVLTVAFANAFTNPPSVLLRSVDGGGKDFYVSLITTTGFSIVNPGTALAAATTYKMDFIAMGN